MSKTRIATAVIAFLLLWVSPSTAEIKTLTITSHTGPTILFHRFGFTHTGHMAVTVSSVSVVAPSQPNPSRLGFVLLSGDSFPQVIREIQQNLTFFCFLDSHYIIPLFTFNDLPPPHAPFNRTYPVTSPGEYSLFFANCDNHSSVSMTVHTEFYNIDNDGSRNYLSSAHTQLPSFCSFFFPFAYFFFLTFWLYHCHVSKRIHLLMASLLFANAVTIICMASVTHYVKVTGIAHGWDVFFFVFHFVRVVLLFTVVVLVGTRWTFLHPLVREKGKKVLLVVIPLQGLANIAYVVIHGTLIEDLGTWYQVMLLLDSISCFAVVFLIVWSIRLLIRKIISKLTQGEDAMNLDKFSLMWRFYMIVITYLFLTRVVLFALKTVVGGEYEWVSNLVDETATLVFCIFIFYVFWLLEKDEYSVIGDWEEHVPEIVIKE